MPLFGLNKKYDIPLVIGAGVVGIMMLLTGYKLAEPNKPDQKKGGKTPKSRKRNIRNNK